MSLSPVISPGKLSEKLPLARGVQRAHCSLQTWAGATRPRSTGHRAGRCGKPERIQWVLQGKNRPGQQEMHFKAKYAQTPAERAHASPEGQQLLRQCRNLPAEAQLHFFPPLASISATAKQQSKGTPSITIPSPGLAKARGDLQTRGPYTAFCFA